MGRTSSVGSSGSSSNGISSASKRLRESVLKALSQTDRTEAPPVPVVLNDFFHPVTESMIESRMAPEAKHRAYYVSFLPRQALADNATSFLHRNASPKNPHDVVYQQLFTATMVLLFCAFRRGQETRAYKGNHNEMHEVLNHCIAIECIYAPGSDELKGWMFYLYENSPPERTLRYVDPEDENYDKKIEREQDRFVTQMIEDYNGLDFKGRLKRCRVMSTAELFRRMVNGSAIYKCAEEEEAAWRTLFPGQSGLLNLLSVIQEWARPDPNDPLVQAPPRSTFADANDLHETKTNPGSAHQIFSIGTAVAIKRAIVGPALGDDGKVMTHQEEVEAHQFDDLVLPRIPTDAVVMPIGFSSLNEGLMRTAIPDIRAMRVKREAAERRVDELTADKRMRKLVALTMRGQPEANVTDWNTFVAQTAQTMAQARGDKLRVAQSLCGAFQTHYQPTTAKVGKPLAAVSAHLWNRAQSGALLSTLKVPKLEYNGAAEDPLHHYLQILCTQLAEICNVDDALIPLRMILGIFDAHRHDPQSQAPRSNMVLLSPPESGKSYLVSNITQLLIPGSVAGYAWVTSKGLTDGNEEQGQILARDEVSGEDFGIMQGSYNSHTIREICTSASGAPPEPNTDNYNLMKSILTGHAGGARTCDTPGNNARDAVMTNAVKFFTMMAASNAPYWFYPITGRTRLIIAFWRGHNIQERINNKVDNSEVRGNCMTQIQDMQAFINLLQWLMNCGLLPSIDREVVTAFMGRYTEKAKSESPAIAAANLNRLTEMVWIMCRTLVLMRIALLYAIAGLGKDPVTGLLSLPELVEKARPLLVVPMADLLFAIEASEFLMNSLAYDVVGALRRSIIGLKSKEIDGSVYCDDDEMKERRISHPGKYYALHRFPPISKQRGYAISLRGGPLDDGDNDDRGGGSNPNGRGHSAQFTDRVALIASEIHQILNKAYTTPDIEGMLWRLTTNCVYNVGPGFADRINCPQLEAVPALKFTEDGTIQLHERAQWQFHRDFAAKLAMHMNNGESMGVGVRGIAHTAPHLQHELLVCNWVITRTEQLMKEANCWETELKVLNKRHDELKYMLEELKNLPPERGYGLVGNGQAVAQAQCQEEINKLEMGIRHREAALEANQNGKLYSQWLKEMTVDGALPEPSAPAIPRSARQRSALMITDEGAAPVPRSELTLVDVAQRNRSLLEASGVAHRDSMLNLDNVARLPEESARLMQRGLWREYEQEVQRRRYSSMGLNELLHWSAVIGKIYTAYDKLVSRGRDLNEIVIAGRYGNAEKAAFLTSMRNFSTSLTDFVRLLRKHGMPVALRTIRHYWDCLLGDLYCPPIGAALVLSVAPSDTERPFDASAYRELAVSCFDMQRATARLSRLWQDIRLTVPVITAETPQPFYLRLPEQCVCRCPEFMRHDRPPRHDSNCASALSAKIQSVGEVVEEILHPALCNIKTACEKLQLGMDGVDYFTLSQLLEMRKIHCTGHLAALLLRAEPTQLKRRILDVVFQAFDIPPVPSNLMRAPPPLELPGTPPHIARRHAMHGISQLSLTHHTPPATPQPPERAVSPALSALMESEDEGGEDPDDSQEEGRLRKRARYSTTPRATRSVGMAILRQNHHLTDDEAVEVSDREAEEEDRQAGLMEEVEL